MKKLLSFITLAALSVALFASCTTKGASTSVSHASSTAQRSSSLAPASSSAPLGINVAGLKGPTTMGMVKLMQDAEAGTTKHNYQVEMFGTADAVVPKLVSGEVDIAAIPANLAATIYNNTNGKIQLAAINTLGVLYVLETGDTIHGVADLKGKTIYSTGKGTTPEFALNYILRQNGLDPATDVNIEFKAEATEVAALLKNTNNAVAVLPQPYVAAVQAQNAQVRVALSLSDEWDKVGEGSSMVTGVLVVRTAFLQDAANAAAFEDFLAEYEASINWVNSNVDEAAALVAQYGIVEKAPIAKAALPQCNIVYVAGPAMQKKIKRLLAGPV